MGWLRRDKDCIALVVVWALLLQAAILSFSFGLHATALASEPNVLCSVRAEATEGKIPVKSQHGPDMACCTTACTRACSAHPGALLVDAVGLPLPGTAAILAEVRQVSPILPDQAGNFAAQPRAPPLA